MAKRRCTSLLQPLRNRSFKTQQVRYASTAHQQFLLEEPDTPIMKTAFPGPASTAAKEALSKTFDTTSYNMMANYQQSRGNYISDPDGNLLLDCFAQIASIALGYNNSVLAKIASSPEMINALINRPALGSFPSHEWSELLVSGILKAAPKGMNQVFTATTGSDANEAAFKAAFIWHQEQQRRHQGIVEFSKEEMDSAMENQAPGAPQLSILSFKSGFHGRTFGSLSTTRSKPIHKIDIPAFDWPQAPFPKLKYPLNSFEKENQAEEQRCLQETERIIEIFPNKVVAAIVEPIQSEGGDNHASPSFFRGLRALTKKHGVLLIVDEVQTGVGATGKFWAHEHWDLPEPPDMVTFSKKAQAAGFYYSNPELRPNMPYRQFNTWMGDPARAILFRSIVEEIESKGLVSATAKTGAYLYEQLERLSERFPHEIQNLRGKGSGTFIAWDSPRRDKILKAAKSLGVNLGGSGNNAIRLRPMLVFERKHADILLSTLEKVFIS